MTASLGLRPDRSARRTFLASAGGGRVQQTSLVSDVETDGAGDS